VAVRGFTVQCSGPTMMWVLDIGDFNRLFARVKEIERKALLRVLRGVPQLRGCSDRALRIVCSVLVPASFGPNQVLSRSLSLSIYIYIYVYMYIYRSLCLPCSLN
jgi:hypothetical protein